MQIRRQISKMYSVIITTTNSKKSAKEIANTLLKKRLAACVQIDKIKSSYIWQEKLQEDREFRLTIKTKSKLYKRVKKAISKIHPYEVPEIIELNIKNISKEYAKWIDETVI